jgi:hypothetical protein
VHTKSSFSPQFLVQFYVFKQRPPFLDFSCPWSVSLTFYSHPVPGWSLRCTISCVSHCPTYRIGLPTGLRVIATITTRYSCRRINELACKFIRAIQDRRVCVQQFIDLGGPCLVFCLCGRWICQLLNASRSKSCDGYVH